MAYRFGKAFIDITANASPLKKALTGTHAFMRGFVRFGTGMMSGMFRRVLGILGGIISRLKDIVKWAGLAAAALYALAVRAAVKQEQAEMRLGAALRATGYAAGFTLQQLKRYAAELQKVTRHGDEALMPIMGMLATFKEIRGPIFKRAMEAILDMSAIMEQDLKSSAIMVGKALNDPIRGMTALRRVGVSFSTEAENTIKKLMETNDIVGAQTIMLKELEGQFKGAERAMANIARGALSRLKNELGDLLELFAKPAIKPFIENIDRLIKWLRSNRVRDAVYSFGERFHLVLKMIKDQLVNIYDYLKVDFLAGLKHIGEMIAETFKTAGQAAGNWLYAGFMDGIYRISQEVNKFSKKMGTGILKTIMSGAGIHKRTQEAILRWLESTETPSGEYGEGFMGIAKEKNRMLWSDLGKSMAEGPVGTLLKNIENTWDEFLSEWKRAGMSKAPTNETGLIDLLNQIILKYIGGILSPRGGGIVADQKKQFKPQFVALEDMYKRLAEQTAGGKNIPKRQLKVQISMEQILKSFYNISMKNAKEISEALNRLVNKNNVGYLGKP